MTQNHTENGLPGSRCLGSHQFSLIIAADGQAPCLPQSWERDFELEFLNL
jgi:hypothetical protein